MAAAARLFISVIVSFFWYSESHPQPNTNFNVQLALNFSSAEQTLDLFEGRSGSPQEVAHLRGSQLAREATELLSQRPLGTQDLEATLLDAKHGHLSGDDVFKMKEAKDHTAAMKELLAEIKRRNFGQRVVRTVEQLFPKDAAISSTIPIYFVAFGHENIAAFVQSIAWNGNQPVVVGEDEGQLTIVVNLSRTVLYGKDVQERFVETLSVVAHEVFHAAFGVYQSQSTPWQTYHRRHSTYLDQLLELTQNEGVAHYLSFEQRGGYFPPDWNERVKEAFDEFNRNGGELLSDQITSRHAGEILRASNTSEYWQSYGAITGLFITLTIDRELGREALASTLKNNPVDFYNVYHRLASKNSNLPRLSELVLGRLKE